MRELVARAVRVKAEVVAEDETESGRRAILNFGHTVGHALEAASGYGLLHGEAVALGMVAALELGAALGVGPAGAGRAGAWRCWRGWRCRSIWRGASTPTSWRASPSTRSAAGSTIRFVLCPEPGRDRCCAT